MPTQGTTPTQIRLTAADKAKLEVIRAAFGLPSLASAIRYAIERTVNSYPIHDVNKARRNSRKNPGQET